MSAAPFDPPVAAGPPRDDEARNDLVTRYRHYVLKIARSVAIAIPHHVDVDDLVSWGYMGLLEAASRYDPSRGTSFRTYAHHRIRGAIFDGVRRELGLNASGLGLVFETLSGRRQMVGDAGYDADDAHSPRRSRSVLLHREPAQDRQVWLAEVRARLETAMASLTPNERAVVHQHYMLGRPMRHVALGTRYSKSWLSRIHSRALAKMRNRLLAEGKEAFL